MKRFIVFIFCLNLRFSFSQTAEYFHMLPPEKKMENSFYNSFQFVDSRPDTNNFGKVYSEQYKRKLPVALKIDLSTQLNWWLHYAVDSAARDSELLFQLRKFEFVQMGGEIPDYGYCPIRAELYVNKNDRYYRLAGLDTFIYADVYADRVEVTPSLFERASGSISSFISANLKLNPENKNPFSYHDILKIDSIEKSSMPLYINKKYVEGAYLSFESFKTQSPDLELIKVNLRYGEIYSMTLKSKKDKSIKRKYSDVYALVYNGKPYLCGEFGCYPLQKINEDFYFKAKGRIIPNDESLALAGALGWALGGIRGKYFAKQISKANALGFFETRLDSHDGSFVWIKKMK